MRRRTEDALDGSHRAGTRARTNRVIDLTLRRCVPSLGVDRRWLRERLAELDVRTHLCEGCLQELVDDADSATWRRVAGTSAGLRYLDVLREEIVGRAEFIHRWTASDERIDGSVNGFAALVRIARKYALPRPWKVSEPVAAQCTRRAPTYWHWATGAESESGRRLSAGAV
jgi:hypothetical protein